MKPSVTQLSTVATTLAAFALFTPAVSQAQLPIDASNATPLVSGLEGPRGLAFGPDGALYIAEAGTAGRFSTAGVCTQVAAPIGPWVGGPTGRITKYLNGTKTILAKGFPSTTNVGGDIIGVADVAFLDGNLYALVSGGGCSHGNPTLPNGVVQVDLNTGNWQYIDNLSAAVAEHPPFYNTYNDYEPDEVPYSMVVEDGSFYVAAPNHAQIYNVTKEGATSLLYDYSFNFADVTPTSIAFREGNMYIGNLGTFPIRKHTERLTTLSKNLVFFDTTPGLETKPWQIGQFRLAGSRAGFTTVVSLKFGPDGMLYALELSDADGYPAPGNGKVVRLDPNGKSIDEVVTGLNVPTAMAFGPDGALYISNWGAAGPGEVLRIVIP